MTGTLSEILDMLKYVIPALLIGAFMWYVRLPTDHIEQEYEYNLSQQVYISDQAWKMVREARRQTQALIAQVIKDGKPKTVPEAQQMLIVYAAEHTLPSEKALDFIKSEARSEF